MEVIAMKVVEQYPMSFQDKIDQMIVGSGWDSLQRQLTLRSENINREIHPAKRNIHLHCLTPLIFNAAILETAMDGHILIL